MYTELLNRILVLGSVLTASIQFYYNNYQVATFFLVLAILLKMDYKVND